MPRDWPGEADVDVAVDATSEGGAQPSLVPPEATGPTSSSPGRHRPQAGAHRPGSSGAGAVASPPASATGTRVPLAVAGCLAVAAASLALPATLAFDPWAWLVWGRDVLHLDLDTTGGPSWKPLPVLASTLVALAGDHAPTVWLVVARAAGLLALVCTFRLAARFAGPAAGVVAASLLLLTPDGGPRFLRLVVEGHSAPVSVSLCLWAIDRHLNGRHAQALLLATAFALDRPEAWPFLGLYATWLWRRDPAQRRLVATALAAVPLLWFGGDWWGSGDPWHGADAAQVATGGIADRWAEAFERMGKMVITPVWVAAVAGTVTARRRREWALVAMGGGALAWMGLVTALSVGFGYAALSRFLLPAAAVLCVLAGIGVVRVVTGVTHGRARLALVAVIVAASVPWAVPRIRSWATVADGVHARARLERELDMALSDADGPEAVLACGRVAITQSDVPRVALAWKLHVPLDRVNRRLPADGPGVLFARTGGRQDRLLSARPPAEVTPLARSTEWAVYAVGCPMPRD